MKSKPLIIFDFDGVIVDSEPIAIGTIQQVLKEYNIEVSMKICYNAFLGKSFKEGLETLSNLHLIDLINLPNSFETEVKSKINTALNKHLKPIPNIHKALPAITNRKCIASGSDYERLQVSLTKTDTGKYFDNVFSSSSVKKGKPAPDVFLYAAHQMGFAPQDCVVIEDSEAGMVAALTAGMKTYLYTPNSTNNFDIPPSVITFDDMTILPFLL